MNVTVRPRRPEDVPVVGALIMRQQPVTRYPFRNPLPFPVEEFVARPGELASWVAEIDGGTVVGHVSVLEVPEGDQGARWVAVTGRPVHELAAVSVLAVDRDHGRRGIAGLLMDVCEAHIRDLGRTPVLEVVADVHSPALTLYLRRGWQVVGDVQPPWLPEGEGPVKVMVLPDPE